MAKKNPNKLPLVIAVCLIAVVSGLFLWMEINLLYAYLLSVSVIAFLFYGYDKRQSLKNGWRIPEVVLHLLALAGGSPGALAGQIVFRHKTKKLKFIIVFAAIVILQAVLIYLYWTRYR
jgi:uncharacterized membrane protein YsdA (DUF1294 family)